MHAVKRVERVNAAVVCVYDGEQRAANVSRQDVCTVAENGKLTAKLRQSNEILSLAADGSVGNVYTLTRDELAAYSVSTSGGLVKKHYVRGAEKSPLSNTPILSYS